MPYVYILKTSSGKYYIESTTNLAKRIFHHKGGFTPSTKSLGEIGLIFSQEYSTLNNARSVERKLKKAKKKRLYRSNNSGR
ncbi:MAG: GIY-YIG nuclease family protein [Candidatus Zambryskibacteria bacterium]|nr:GIY-YIG nuclease family protein [Candidatus Zambryskibacteria bacterium]